MINFLVVVCALLGAQSFAIKVSVTFTSCDSYISDKVVSLIEPEGCLLLQYPERDSKDVAVLTDGVSESGSNTWNTPLGRAPKTSLKIRFSEGNMNVTFYNNETEKEQSIKNLKNGQEFEVSDGIISDDALSMSLEEVARLLDADPDDKAGVLKFHERQLGKNSICGDIYRLQVFCVTVKNKGFCGKNAGKDNELLRRWCKGTCGLCKPIKLPKCGTLLSTPAPHQ